MTINNNYNFGLLTDDGNGNPTSLQNLKSFTINYNSNNSEWEVTNSLNDYFVQYYNKLTPSNGPGEVDFSGLVVYNKNGKNFIILLQNVLQQYITTANYITFNGPGTLPNINNLDGLMSITYPELPTFINSYNGYNIPRGVLNTDFTSYTFYIIE